MGKITFNTRIIGKSGNLLMLSNDFKASLDGFYEKAFVIEADTGKHLTDYHSVDFLLRTEEELEWEPRDEFYDNVYPNRVNRNYSRDGLIGFAVGDALGVPVEFLNKADVRKINVQDMMGNDTNINFGSRWSDTIPAGAWSDDTSMTYATMDSIVRNKGLNYDDIMKSYLNWWEKGEYTSLDIPFGLGETVADALGRFKRGMPAVESGGKGIRDNGNGALMRIFPISLYCIEKDLSEEETVKVISDSSALTHGHDISKMSCFIYTEFLKGLIETKNPKLAFSRIQDINYYSYFSKEALEAHKKLLGRKFASLPDEDINGSGYVVDTLECAIYSIMNTENYEDAVKMAINTGYDTDTIGGITGSLAGVLYGEENIPERWKNNLKKKDELDLIAIKYNFLMDSYKSDIIQEMLSRQEEEVSNPDKNNNKNF